MFHAMLSMSYMHLMGLPRSVSSMEAVASSAASASLSSEEDDDDDST